MKIKCSIEFIIYLYLQTPNFTMNIDTLITVLSSQSFDDGKNKSLKALINSMSKIEGHEVSKLLKLYSFDDGKINALKIMSGKIQNVTGTDISNILSTYSFDDGKNDALSILVKNVNSVNANEMPKILSKFSFDSGKSTAMNILNNKVNKSTNTTVDICTILNNLSFDNAKEDAFIKYVSDRTTMDLSEIDNVLKCVRFKDTKKNILNHIAQKLKITNNSNLNVFDILESHKLRDLDERTLIFLLNYNKEVNMLDLLKYIKYKKEESKLTIIFNVYNNINKMLSSFDCMAETFSEYFTDKSIYSSVCEKFGVTKEIYEKYYEQVENNDFSDEIMVNGVTYNLKKLPKSADGTIVIQLNVNYIIRIRKNDDEDSFSIQTYDGSSTLFQTISCDLIQHYF